ncbi:MAG: zinc ribbon domain-containing protein [Chloroflexi bacterium]|nr:zinc ribbon domain-containing protein [Chloroflexota bacterium]
MPIYEYRCCDCEYKFEVMRGMSQADAPIACEECNGNHTTRMLSTFNAHGSAGTITHTTSDCGSCSGGSCASCHH